MLAQFVRTVVSGFLMGTADLVPGVSGGTIALVLGIYERLVHSIREGSSALGAILRRDWEGFRRHFGAVEWGFLLPLLGGILAAVGLLASFLEHQLQANPTLVAGLFFGLVVMSLSIAWHRLRKPRPAHVSIALGVALATFLLLGAGGGAAVSNPTLLVFFGAGALAICAMILPGISGSLILVLVGMYAPVLGAVTSRNALALGVFAAGAAVGLALFSQLLDWALTHHHDIVVAALVGLMGGSLRILWPWPDGVAGAGLGAPGSDWTVVVGAGVVGALAVYVVAHLASDREDLVTP